MALTIYDINIVADIATLMAAIYLFVRWRNLNPKMAWSFLLFGVMGIASMAFGYYQLAGNVHFFLRSLMIIVRIFFLTYGISQMIRGSRPLFYSYLLFTAIPFTYLMDPNMSRLYTTVGLVASVVSITFFAFLFVQKSKEIKVVALAGIAAMVLSAMFAILLGRLDTPQHFYIPRLLLALMFIGLAHLSVHAPNHIYNVKRRRVSK